MWTCSYNYIIQPKRVKERLKKYGSSKVQTVSKSDPAIGRQGVAGTHPQKAVMQKKALQIAPSASGRANCAAMISSAIQKAHYWLYRGRPGKKIFIFDDACRSTRYARLCNLLIWSTFINNLTVKLRLTAEKPPNQIYWFSRSVVYPVQSSRLRGHVFKILRLDFVKLQYMPSRRLRAPCIPIKSHYARKIWKVYQRLI